MNEKIRVRTYNIGKGECTLVSFNDVKQRHILIDFGSESGFSKSVLKAVANNIEEETEGKLDVLVITHDQPDRLSGFQQNREIFKKFEIEQIWLNRFCDPVQKTGDERLSELEKSRELAHKYPAHLQQTKKLVSPILEERVHNCKPCNDELEFIRGLAPKKIHYLDRSTDVNPFPFSEEVELTVHNPWWNPETFSLYKFDEEINAVSRIHKRLKARLEDPANVTHPMFGNKFKQVDSPSHLSPQDWRVLRNKSFTFGVNEIKMIEQAVDNASLIFSLKIYGKNLFFAGDISYYTWYWTTWCDACELKAECAECKSIRSHWKSLDLCKFNSYDLSNALFSKKHKITDYLKSSAKVITSVNTEKSFIEALKKEHQGNVVVSNAPSNPVWTDTYV